MTIDKNHDKMKIRFAIKNERNYSVKRTVIKIVSKRQEFDESLANMIGELLDAEINEGANEDALEDAETSYNKLKERFDDSKAIEVITEGSVTEDDEGNIEISYCENDADSAKETVVRIVFNKKAPGLVSVVRTGEMNTMLSFETCKRHKCFYHTPYMPLEIVVSTVEVKNTFLTDGRLFLNYLIQVKGLSCDRCTIDLEMIQIDS